MNKFNRLTITDEFIYKNKRKYYKCICDCGGHTYSTIYDVKSGNTKSCGCIKKEISSKQAYKNIKKLTKYDPITASARMVFRERYSDGNISFEDFLKLSQLNCFYCNEPPSNIANSFTSARSSKENKKIANFTYNGLDRINNLRSHCIDNVVTSCKYCNYAKRERSLNEFIVWIENLNINFTFNNLKDYNKINDIKKDKNIIKIAKKYWKENYSDGLSFEDFLLLSQENCFYCSQCPSNNIKNIFIYNGIDRIDSNKSHIIENVVTSCKYCNYAKRELSFTEFNERIKRWKENLKISNYINP